MRVFIDGKVYDSDDQFISVYFNRSEIGNFKSSPYNVDVFASWPKEWGKEKGEYHMNKNKAKLIKSNSVDHQVGQQATNKSPEFKLIDTFQQTEIGSEHI